MAEDFQLTQTDAGTIYNMVIKALEQGVDEPLYPGDERRIFGEALAAVLVAAYNKLGDVARQKMLRYARGPVLDALGERYGTPRLAPRTAQTVLRFSVSTPRPHNIVIPQGTRVTADSVRYFATGQPAVLQAGLFSVDVSATALLPGGEYNGLMPGTVKTLVDLLPYMDRVVNLNESHGGADGEPYSTAGDDRYRERIRIAPSKWSTAGPDVAYAYWAMSADSRIIDVKAISPAPSCVTIVPLLEGGIVPDAQTLAAVLAAVDDPSVRPLTDKVSVEAPTVVPYDIELTYFTTQAEESDVILQVEGENGAIVRYNSWQQNKLGRHINPDQLRRLILAPDWEENLTGAVRTEIISPAFTEIAETAVAKWTGSLKVQHMVVRR